MAVGLGVMGLAPSTFWTMTPRELNAAMRGRFGDSAQAPLSKTDLASLINRFPDTEGTKDA